MIVRDLDRLFRVGAAFATDAELLRRFLTRGDGDAFEAIVDRHGPMVRGVCGRLLRDPHDADDAFQATFLVLARDGGKLRHPDRLASWLYSIARRASLRARVRAHRRRAEPLLDDLPAPEDPRAEWSDVRPILDAELARLPAAQRDVLVLCLLGGASEQEASRRLDCPVGTVKSRLSRAREALRGRLVKRGVAPATALAAVSSVEAFASPVSLELLRATLASVSAKAAIPPSIAVLAQGVAPTMISRPIVLTLALVGGLGVLGWTASAWTPNAAGQPGRPVAGARSTDPSQVKFRNLRRILSAMQDWTQASAGSFPNPLSGGTDGHSKLSWRVALLPDLGERELYKQFHHDEHWDSPHNRALIPRMPAVFQTPDAPTPAGQTRFRAFSSPDAVYDRRPITRDQAMGGMMMMMGSAPGAANEGMMGMGMGALEGKPVADEASPAMVHVPLQPQISEIHDGTSNTLLIAVAAEPVEWTRPLEIENVAEEEMDAHDGRGLVIGMCDGAVRFLPPSPNRLQFLSSLVTRSGGEVIDWSMYLPREVPKGLEPIPLAEAVLEESTTPPGEPEAAAPAPSIDQRLRRVEEKLDRLLQKLGGDDAPPP